MQPGRCHLALCTHARCAPMPERVSPRDSTTLPAAWASVLNALALAVAGPGCVDRRSEKYTCSSDDECDGPRTCRSGWCVAYAAVDGGATATLSTFDCTEDESCAEPIVCPPGVSCHVDCGGERACEGPITCAAGMPCTVTCRGKDACKGGVALGAVGRQGARAHRVELGWNRRTKPRRWRRLAAEHLHHRGRLALAAK